MLWPMNVVNLSEYEEEIEEDYEVRYRRYTPFKWNVILIAASVVLLLGAGVWAGLLELSDHYSAQVRNYIGPILLVTIATPLFWGTVLHAIIRSAVRGAVEATR
jgi:hypothetical protein